MSFSPEDVLVALDTMAKAEGLSYLLVGGNAVNAHHYLRTTYDVDLAIRETDKAQWDRQMRNLGYEVFFGTPAFSRYRQKADKQSVPVDLMILDESTYTKLKTKSQERVLAGRDYPVPDVLHVIAMKLHALRQPHREANTNDLNDVISLIKKLKIDVQSEDFITIFERYGTPEIQAKILRDIG